MNESLPNITGMIERVCSGTALGTFTGVFDEVSHWENNKITASGIINYIQKVSFDASISSSVYSNNAKVKPDTCKTNIVIKY